MRASDGVTYLAHQGCVDATEGAAAAGSDAAALGAVRVPPEQLSRQLLQVLLLQVQRACKHLRHGCG